MIKIISILLTILSITGCKKKLESTGSPETLQKDSDFFFVTASPFLNVREKPDLNSKILFTIPDRSIVEKIQETELQVNIDNKQGKWVQIRFSKNNGWVFNSFLTKKSDEYMIKIKEEWNPSKTIKFTLKAEGSLNDAVKSCHPDGDQFIYGCSLEFIDNEGSEAAKKQTDIFPIRWINDYELLTRNKYGEGNYYHEGISKFDIRTEANTPVWEIENIYFSETPSWGPSDGEMKKQNTLVLCKHPLCYEMIQYLDRSEIEIFKGNKEKRSELIFSAKVKEEVSWSEEFNSFEFKLDNKRFTIQDNKVTELNK